MCDQEAILFDVQRNVTPVMFSSIQKFMIEDDAMLLMIWLQIKMQLLS